MNDVKMKKETQDKKYNSDKKTQKVSKNSEILTKYSNFNENNAVFGDANNSSKLSSEESVNMKLVWKNSIFKFLKILLCAVCFLFFMIFILFLFFPANCANVFKFFGAFELQEKCLVRNYEKSGEPYDLYELILVQDEHKNFSGELESVCKMLSLDDYEIFCDALDRESLKDVSADMFGYVGNSRAYFLGKQVKCQILLNGNANALVCKNLNSTNLTENTFAVAVRTILNIEGLDDFAKKTKIDDLLQTWNSEFSENDVETLVLNRIEDLKQSISDLFGSNKIIAGFSLFDVSDALLNARILQGNETKIDEARQIFDEARQIYLSLL